MSLLLIIVVLLLLFGSSYGYRNGSSYGGPGIGLGTILLIILIVLLVTGRI